MTTEEMQALLREPGALGPGGAGAPPSPCVTFDRVTEDSRAVRPGTLFFAVSGGARDGHEFAADAAARGAVGISGERNGIAALEGLPYIHVAHARRALGAAAQHLAGEPSARMRVVGVTGTNGKSSTTAFIAQLLRQAGHRCATIGTLGYSTGAATRESAHTTPFGETLAALFAEAKRDGCSHLVMEVSSHAIAQERIAGIQFEGAVLTNVTQDHLDYHADFDAYRTAKISLFERIAESGFAVINGDDPSAAAFSAACRGRVYTYGAKAEIAAVNVSIGPRGTKFKLKTPWGSSAAATPLFGVHNVANSLAAAGAAGALGVPFDTIVAGLASLEGVPGRFERLDEGQPFQVVVDYAHTEDGLRNVLAAARPLCAGKLICVFGCGGDRDKTKRPKMAGAVAHGADFSVITSDNPRSENPERILLDIEVGMQRAGKTKRLEYEMIVDRREAIRFAIAMARPGDFILIAGKGHENYQILNAGKVHFDDRETARELLAEGMKSRA